MEQSNTWLVPNTFLTNYNHHYALTVNVAIGFSNMELSKSLSESYMLVHHKEIQLVVMTARCFVCVVSNYHVVVGHDL